MNGYYTHHEGTLSMPNGYPSNISLKNKNVNLVGTLEKVRGSPKSKFILSKMSEQSIE